MNTPTGNSPETCNAFYWASHHHYFHDWDDIKDQLPEMLSDGEQPPTVLHVCKKLPINVDVDDIWEWLRDFIDDNYHNDEGSYASEFFEEGAEQEFKKKLTPILQDLSDSNTWRQYEQTKVTVPLEWRKVDGDWVLIEETQECQHGYHVYDHYEEDYSACPDCGYERGHRFLDD